MPDVIEELGVKSKSTYQIKTLAVRNILSLNILSKHKLIKNII